MKQKEIQSMEQKASEISEIQLSSDNTEKVAENEIS